MKFDMTKEYKINGIRLAYIFTCLNQGDIEACREELERVLKEMEE